MVNSLAINNTDWILVSLIPFEEIISTGSQFKNYMLFLILTIIFIAYLFAYLISNSSIKRIGFLVKSMEKLEQGIFQTDMPVHGKDEIGRLMEKFNYMSKKMEQMVKEKFEAGQKIKNAELKALQSQINPHFLYNTLDMINWSAAINQVSDIVQTVQNLAKFYKLSLSKGKDIIPISDEIELIKAYVEIQNQRFEDRIKFDLDIDEKVYEYSTLKIIIQPFVENAILHGIMGKANRAGSIKITARIVDNNIVFIVEDDGIGIAEDKINSILIKEMSSHNKGYGIKNINDRIKLYFGEQYGLKYLSEINRGTKVEISIPMIK
jgi:two-component system sensor histidine kinase YesM